MCMCENTLRGYLVVLCVENWLGPQESAMRVAACSEGRGRSAGLLEWTILPHKWLEFVVQSTVYAYTYVRQSTI